MLLFQEQNNLNVTTRQNITGKKNTIF